MASWPHEVLAINVQAGQVEIESHRPIPFRGMFCVMAINKEWLEALLLPEDRAVVFQLL